MRPIVGVLLVLAISASATAQRPLLIPLQGMLTDESGTPINGSVTLHLALYDQAEGGTALWSETQIVQVTSGVFGLFLGNESTISPELFEDQLWLGMAVDADAEMAPRSFLGVSPYAVGQYSPFDNDATIIASPILNEPSVIGSITGSSAPVDVLDFTISDGGGGDMLPTLVSDIVVRVSGTADAADAAFLLSGPGVSAVAGSIGGAIGNQTITFSSLSISVADGTLETYTMSMQLDATPTSTSDGDYFVLSVNAQDAVTSGGTQFSGGTPITNGSGLAYSVAATQLTVTTQPGATEVRGVPFDFVVEYQDANGNRDADISGDVVTLTESSTIASFVQPPSGSVVAVGGVASFTGVGTTQVILSAPSALIGIMLIATDDAGGSINLSGVPVNSISFDLD